MAVLSTSYSLFLTFLIDSEVPLSAFLLQFFLRYDGTSITLLDYEIVRAMEFFV